MYSFKSKVRYSELAPDKKLSLVSIINYFQDCCTFEAEHFDVGLEWLGKHRTAWMLTSWQIHIIRRPEYCEDIEITTWACGFKYFIGKRSFLIRTLSGEVLVYALSDWAYVNVDKGLPEKNVPEKEIKAYGLDVPIDKRFEEFGINENPEKVILKGKIDTEFANAFCMDMDEKAVTGRGIRVSGEHLDTNDHVNNGQYVAIALSAFPMDSDVKIFRAEYKMQSKLGDVLYPVISTDEEINNDIESFEDGKEQAQSEMNISNNTNSRRLAVLDESGRIKMACEFIF